MEDTFNNKRQPSYYQKQNKSNQIKNQRNENYSIKESKFKIGKRTYRKIQSQDKIEDKWERPFLLTARNENQITLREETKIIVQNIRNIRLKKEKNFGNGCFR